jgi:hypothetical protein
MREIIENFQGTDEELLLILNEKNIKKVNGDGMVTLAMVGDVSVELAAAVNFTLESVLANLSENSLEEKAQKSMLSRFLDRFTVSDRGLDLANETVRTTMTEMLTLGGMNQESITLLLNLGAYYISAAEKALGREATIEDIETEREIINRELLQQRWQDLFLSIIQPALQTGSEQEIVEAIGQVAEEF